MFDKEFYIAQLVAARVKGTISAAEEAALDTWINANEGNKLQYHKYLDEKELDRKIKQYYAVDSAAIFQKITEGLKNSEEVGPVSPVKAERKIRLWPSVGIAAAVILVAFSAIWLLQSGGSLSKAQPIQYASDAVPGKEGATLMLANGRKIHLGSAVSGELAKEAGVSISKSADGKLVYVVEGNVSDNSANTLSTGNGETYQVKLPDGSTVWLNSASSITYRTSMNDNGMRRVKLTGEAYFEIVKDAVHPFVVSSEGQDVKVLGTHFNINSYVDEPVTATTLLEGSVQISSNDQASGAEVNQPMYVLKPGEQALNNKGSMQVKKVDVADVTDWKQGEFNLQGVAFDVLMRKIARWYNVEVIYDQAINKNVQIGGWISRDKQLSQVLSFIESSGAVHFKIEKNKVTVLK